MWSTNLKALKVVAEIRREQLRLKKPYTTIALLPHYWYHV